ncbi:GNAT family N-acetyltransferase [Actinoplanes sp. TFC3]|uniref:GNAT family N-acetyltransferase n=1 Tax=Actinoplanes sp. TFC3 TaxID=1710355 RepID=UPI00082FF1FE|nr:GNAT family N-acetyltransferase [Actinoplanes sp. TFC3]
MSTVTTTGWAVETRCDDGALVAVRDEWVDLYGRCATASPFQAHGWVAGWWQAYGQRGRLRLTLVRHGGRLVAVAPMMLVRRRGGVGVLVPLGGQVADFTDVLVDDAIAGPASARLADALVRDRGWQVVDVPESRPGAVTGGALLDAWPGRRYRLDASLCLRLPAVPLPDFLATLSSKQRRSARHEVVRLERCGLRMNEVSTQEAGRAVPELLRLHAMQWQGRGIQPEHLRPAFAQYLTRAVTLMLADEQAVLVEYRDGNRLLASHLMFAGRDVLGGYLYGVDPELRKRVDVTTMLLTDMVPRAHRLGLAASSQLRGDEAHKLRWRPVPERNSRLLLVRPGSAAGAWYAASVRAGRAGVAVAKKHAPWLRAVRDRVRR